MAYIDFLKALAKLQGLANEQELLDRREKFGSQIQSRDRARDLVGTLSPEPGLTWHGVNVLDIGCGYGALSVELAGKGARVTGVDTSARWLALAEENARDEVNADFLRADASSREIVRLLADRGPFGFFVLKDVLQHIADPAALFDNVARLAAAGARIYYRIVNPRAIRYVLADPAKQIFGITLLAAEQWKLFTGAPTGLHVRRWELYRGLFEAYGFAVDDRTPVNDMDEDYTRRHIERGVRDIKRKLKPENFPSPEQLTVVRTAYKTYSAEVEDDLRQLDWRGLYRKYRAQAWEGILTLRHAEAARAAA